MIYFFNMQCPDCDYISFKQEKECGSCGFSFKKAATSTDSLFRNDSFTIFATKAPEVQESSSAPSPMAGEDIAVIEPSEGESPELASGDFLLNLDDAKQDTAETPIKPETSDADTVDFSSMEFGTDVDINLEEMEVEGLGLGLEPLEEEPPTPSEAEETQVDVSVEPETVDLSPENIELKIDGLDSSSAEEPEVTNSADEDIELKINELEDTPADVDSEKDDEELKITPSQDLEQDSAEPVAPVLDLGSIDEEPEPEKPEPAPPQVETDELEIKLEIDDSDGPLTISDDETPEIEIEDLGLELEESDSPDPEKP